MAFPAYRTLIASATLMSFGVMGQVVARGWLARDLTGSNAGLGGVMMVFGGVMLILTPAGGMAADRYPRRAVLAVSLATMAVSSLLVAVPVIAGVIRYWMLVLAAALQAAGHAFYLPARASLIPELVEPAAVHNGLVLSQMSHELSRMVAPALAGLMIGVTWFGLGGVFLAGAATSVMALVFATRLPQLPRRATSTASGLSDLASAVRYVRTTHKLGAVSLSAVGVILCGFPYLVLLPALATDRFGAGPVEFGVMSGTAGLGALVAGMGGASLEALVGPAALVPASGTVAGISVLALSIAGSLPVALGALLVIGASLMVFQTSAQAYMMQLAEPAYHGRVQSILVFGYSGAMLAAFPIGLLADVLSLRDALVVMGVGILLFVAPAMVRGGGAHRPAVADRGDRQAGSRRGRSASARRASGRTTSPTPSICSSIWDGSTPGR